MFLQIWNIFIWTALLFGVISKQEMCLLDIPVSETKM